MAVLLVSAFAIVAFEESGHYVETAAIIVVAVPIVTFVNILPGLGGIRRVEQWAAGHQVDPMSALEASYSWARAAVTRTVVSTGVTVAVTATGVGTIAGATGFRLLQWAILGAAVGLTAQLLGARSYFEGAMRPVRMAIAGHTGVGDALPRSRPTFATWSNTAMLAAVFQTPCPARYWER